MSSATAPVVRGVEHWELVRALGAFALTPPPGNVEVCRALGLRPLTGAQHTGVFVLGLPPHAAIHLGPEGKLGGEGLDRVSGFWRALGLRSTEDADHLGALLMLYAELGAAEQTTTDERWAEQLHRSRRALLHEHLWTWAPAYLHAVTLLPIDCSREWAALTLECLREEVRLVGPAESLPLALREAPVPIGRDATREEVLDALVTPVRSGVVLSWEDLQRGAHQVGVGLRRGERRYALRAMMEQDPRASVSWLQRLVEVWAELHGSLGDDPTSLWWRERATATAMALSALLGRQPGTPTGAISEGGSR